MLKEPVTWDSLFPSDKPAFWQCHWRHSSLALCVECRCVEMSVWRIRNVFADLTPNLDAFKVPVAQELKHTHPTEQAVLTVLGLRRGVWQLQTPPCSPGWPTFWPAHPHPIPPSHPTTRRDAALVEHSMCSGALPAGHSDTAVSTQVLALMWRGLHWHALWHTSNSIGPK